ncbi:DNA binding protein [Aureococcus anophagefferens]|nr:DNA binding protein [Aureococcus anophagefferens]
MQFLADQAPKAAKRAAAGVSEAAEAEGAPAEKRARPEPGAAAPEEVAGFVRTLFTLLRVCDPAVIRWGDDGASVAVADPQRFAAEVCPKFFRHRNFNSFTRLLNMYCFHKVPAAGRDRAVSFAHPHFRRGREDLLGKIKRKGAAADRGDGARAGDRGAAGALAQRARRAPRQGQARARTNAEITSLEKTTGYLSQAAAGGSSAVSTWMRRVVELEKEGRRLRAENDRLRAVEAELGGLGSAPDQAAPSPAPRRGVARRRGRAGPLPGAAAAMAEALLAGSAVPGGVAVVPEPPRRRPAAASRALWDHVLRAGGAAGAPRRTPTATRRRPSTAPRRARRSTRRPGPLATARARARRREPFMAQCMALRAACGALPHGAL